MPQGFYVNIVPVHMIIDMKISMPVNHQLVNSLLLNGVKTQSW